MGLLHVDTQVSRQGDRLVADVSRDWEVWGPNGGYVSAIALRAAGLVAPPGHRPASLSVQYVSVGGFGETECRVTPVKQGRSAWLLNVELIQQEKVFLQAQVWSVARDDGPETAEAEMPDAPPPAALKTFRQHVVEHYGDAAPEPHVFWTNIDVKPLSWQPFEAPRTARPATLVEWFNFPGFDPGDDAFAAFAPAVVLIDTLLWPTHHRGRAQAPDYIAPSLDLTVWFHEPPRGAQWLLLDAVSDTARAGLIHGRGRLWTEDGRLVATGGSNLIYTPKR
ncbi:thioesterase family protein [Phenylobacterium sp.]|uniref:acyl-CoA thioesterase n=1 Tax=Phenylobacterium sp. TaxID=1871053 RepID=UPI002810B986|nr:thioesterase family protein [Phenylobacterium sp.]